MSETTGRPRARDRAAADAAQATDQGPGKDVERRPTGVTLAQRVDMLAPQLQQALPKGVEARQLIRDMAAVVRATPKVGECQPVSVLGALMTCAQLGLRPGVLGQAFIVPFWSSADNGYVATFVPGYRGLIQLGYRHPSVAKIGSRSVYPGDEFAMEYGFDEYLRHKPIDPSRGDGATAPVGFYTVWKGVNGGGTFFHMTREEMIAWRDRYAPRGRPRDGVAPIVGPWAKPEHDDQRIAMGLKTTVRRLARDMPLSIELVSALVADGGVRRETDPDARPEEVTVFDQITAPEPSADGGPGEYDPTQEPGWGAGGGE